MITCKQTILTAVHIQGANAVKEKASKLADDLMCSRSYVLSIVRQVERGDIVTRWAA